MPNKTLFHNGPGQRSGSRSQQKFFFLLAKLRKPILSLNITASPKKFKFRRHYSYSHIKEYQFSPAKSKSINHPFIQFRMSYSRKRSPNKGRFSFRKNITAYLFNSITKCLGQGRDGGDGDGRQAQERGCIEMEMTLEHYNYPFQSGRCKNENYCLSSSSRDPSWDYNEEVVVIDSVDERAERFIQRFYQDMRRQTQLDSHL